ncbi:MAG TPA: glycosyl hydrolase family 65 protein, partial [Noviherbaspirillum sp.]|nr:glycosyl hydrolase family 65 protein [Noviherbaspirillum sp.]
TGLQRLPDADMPQGLCGTCAAWEFTPADDPLWLMIDDEFTPIREHEFESLFSVSNGYLGSRASLPFGITMSTPTVFIAGVFDVTPPSSLRELVAIPGWTLLSQSIGPTHLSTQNLLVIEHRRMLDMREGMFRREFRFGDKDGHVMRIQFLRIASLADQHVLLQSSLCESETYSGPMAIHSGFLQASETAAKTFAPRASNRDTPYGPIQVFEWETHAGLTIALALASRFSAAAEGMQDPYVSRVTGQMDDVMHVEVEAGKAYRNDWLEVTYTSRDTEQPAEAAIAHLERLLPEGAKPIIRNHVDAWNARWQLSDVVIEGDPDAQRAIRFACYHLISTANPEDGRVSVGARALTGPAYKGHIFWDTEIFLLPFYVLTHPPSARALLMYRFHTLPAARGKARAHGYRGALYAWESADTGEEVTPSFAITPVGEVIPVLTGMQSHHISADVAYAVWQYWQATGDDDFLCRAGAEILMETARFWASRGNFENDGHYHIRKVIGPDEYHEAVDDNAYTNWMAQWNMECAAAVCRMLQERWPEHWQTIAKRIRLDEEEPAEWLAISERMYTGVHPDSALIEQFEGYLGLEDIELSTFYPRSLPIDVVLGRERTRRTKILKQADVVMLLHLFSNRIATGMQKANFLYYEPRTEHGSSLSPAIHALVAARLGDTEMALRYFRQAREIDLADNMGNAAGGVHIAALGGLWQAAIFGFAGLSLNERGIAFTPHLPAGWQRMCFPLLWHGQKLAVTITPALLEIELLEGTSLQLSLGEAPDTQLEAGFVSRWEFIDGQWKEFARERR